jgi:hypothetical protein
MLGPLWAHAGADGLGWFGNMRYYVEGLATSGGVILLVCFALGVLWSIRLRLLGSIPLWSGAIVWVILSGVPLHWDRWALPMYLTPLLIAPIGAYYSFRYLLDKGAARWLLWGAVGLGIAIAANLVAGSAAVSARYVSKNSQTFTSDFAARGIDATNTLYEGYTPLLPGAFTTVFDRFQVVDGRLVVSSRDPHRSGMRYVVLSSSMYHRYKAEPKYGDEQKFYALLDKQFPLLTTYYPAAQGKPTAFEIPSIWNALVYVGDVAHVGSVARRSRSTRFPPIADEGIEPAAHSLGRTAASSGNPLT